MKEKKQAPTIQLKDGTRITAPNMVMAGGNTGKASYKQRQELYNSLQNEHLKRKGVLTIADLQKTFVKTDLTSVNDKSAKLELLRQKTQQATQKTATGKDDEHPDDDLNADEDAKDAEDGDYVEE